MEGLINYSRQEAMNNELGMAIGYTNVIIGCGGIGFWLGIMLAMNGYEKFILIDKDKLEPTNLNRIPAPPTWIGVNKAVALRKIMSFLRPDTAIKVIPMHIKEDTIEFFEKVVKRLPACNVWDTTDNATDQQRIFKVCKGLDSSYHKIGYEGFKLGVYKNYDIWTAKDYVPGYRTTMANSCSSVMAASLGIFAKGLCDKDFEVDLKELLTK